MVSNPIHRHNCLENTLSQIEQKARDRLVLKDFRQKVFLKSSLDFDCLNLDQKNLIFYGYVLHGSTKINQNDGSIKTIHSLFISKKGIELLNSPIYKILSVFAKYF